MDRLFGQGVEVSAENMLDVFPDYLQYIYVFLPWS